MGKTKSLEWVVSLLVGIGAFSLGLANVLNFDIVDWLLNLVNFASYSIFIYGAIGIAGAYSLYKLWF